MANLMDKVSNIKKPEGLKKAIVQDQKKELKAKENHRPKAVKEEPESIKKAKKVNASFSIDCENDKALRKYVLTLKLANMDKEEEQEVSASAIVNELITEFLATKK